jgi:hypothetical protein
VSVTGNITGGNVLGGANVNATTHTGTTVSVTGNITGGNILGTLVGGAITGTTMSATGNITGGNVLGGANVNATTHTGTTVSVSGTITGGNVVATTVRTTPTIVGSLPAAATAGAGSRAFVTDATSITFGATAVGGAANNMPVFSNGTAWLIG